MRRAFRAIILSIAMMLSACAGTRQPLPPSTISFAAPRDLPGVANFSEVSPGVYRGAQPTAEGFRTLKDLGVKTIVNLRAMHDDTGLMQGSNLGYVQFPSHAWDVDESELAAILKLIHDPANRPIFIHCQHGADRTGVTIAAYRMVEQGWAPDQALEEVRAFGFHELWGNIPRYIRECDVTVLAKRAEQAIGPKIVTIP